MGSSSPATAGHPLGWTVYHDSQDSFALLIPPGWRVSPLANTLSTGGLCGHIIRVFPPDTVVNEKQAMSQLGEQVYVRVVLGCDDWPAGGHDGYFTPAAHPISISGAAATMYDSSPNVDWSQHVATARFGGHEFIFGVQSPPERTQRDSAAYLLMVLGFRYTG